MIENRRAGFAMLLALAVIITLSIIASLVMNVSAKTVTETTAQYQREQAAILARSYTEYAIMAVTANDRTADDCVEDIIARVGPDPLHGQGYEVRINIAYIVDKNDVNLTNCAATRRLYNNNIVTTRTPLNIIVDAYVKYKDLDDPRMTGANSFSRVPWKVYHRRTLQKI